MKPQTMRYKIHVKEHLDPCWLGWFDGLEVTNLEEGAPTGGTLLLGEVLDQAALFGILARIRDLNLTLIEVRALE